MGRVQTERGSIGVDESGDGDATPIIFLHGVGSDKSVWRRQLDHFSADRRAIAFDQPGYGESDPAADGAAHDEFAAAILAAMDALEIERAHICGLSLGGVIAIALNHAAPQRVASLILADSFAAHPDGHGIYARSTKASRAMTMRELADDRVDLLLAPAANPALRDEVTATMAAINPDAYRTGARAVWLADQRDRLSAITAPSLVIVGGEDQITPPMLSRDLAVRIAGARLVEIADAGHLANLEKPSAFNAAIDQFISTLDEEI